MVGAQTRGGRMEGTDESTELWQHHSLVLCNCSRRYKERVAPKREWCDILRLCQRARERESCKKHYYSLLANIKGRLLSLQHIWGHTYQLLHFAASVTRWLDYVFNIWQFTTKKLPVSKKNFSLKAPKCQNFTKPVHIDIFSLLPTHLLLPFASFGGFDKISRW